MLKTEDNTPIKTEKESPSAQVATPLSTEIPSKSSDNVDQGLTKKLKKLGGHAVPVGNGSAEGDAEGLVYKASQSGEHGIVGSTEGSDENTGAYQSQRQSGSEGMLSTDPGVACVASAGAGLSFEAWVQDERQLKRERRKQANRESARRSRLRKQAENEELTMRYESLTVENMALKSELNQLTEGSEKLRLENAALLEKLNRARPEPRAEMVRTKIEKDLALPNTTGNLLGLNNSDSVTGIVKRECESTENSNSEIKLHQRLESSSRADAVAAG